MGWWKTALFDTCSLITLDRLILERKSITTHFPKTILALEESFTKDQLHAETVERMRVRVTTQPLPSPTDLSAILATHQLSRALASVDTLVYAAAVHENLSVVTGDRQLAKALVKAGVQVANMALLLQELVSQKKLTESSCENLLKALARQNDLILGTREPSWSNLKSHKFP